MNTTKVIEVPAVSLERGASLHRALTSSVDLFALLSVVCVSCKPEHVNSTIHSIDSLLVVVKNCEIKLEENHVDTIKFFNRF